jgi:hypothetical protein
MTQFVQKYNSPSDSLSRHFSRPIFSDSCNKIFGEIQYIEILPANCITNSGSIRSCEFIQFAAVATTITIISSSRTQHL